MYSEHIAIGGVQCNIYATPRPRVLLVQPSARHEQKDDGLCREAAEIERLCGCGFAMAAFDTVEWARALMPWHDDAVSRDEETGRHAPDTLHFVLHELLPWMRARYGCLPCIIGGYSLGGLFALWAAAHTSEFGGVAAASPSLWIEGWTPYAQHHPTLAQCAYISLGDREAHCRNQRMQRIADCVRTQHSMLRQQLGDSRTTLEWNKGGHFGDEAARTARAFAWCINNITNTLL